MRTFVWVKSISQQSAKNVTENKEIKAVQTPAHDHLSAPLPAQPTTKDISENPPVVICLTPSHCTPAKVESIMRKKQEEACTRKSRGGTSRLGWTLRNSQKRWLCAGVMECTQRGFVSAASDQPGGRGGAVQEKTKNGRFGHLKTRWRQFEKNMPSGTDVFQGAWNIPDPQPAACKKAMFRSSLGVYWQPGEIKVGIQQCVMPLFGERTQLAVGKSQKWEICAIAQDDMKKVYLQQGPSKQCKKRKKCKMCSVDKNYGS